MRPFVHVNCAMSADGKIAGTDRKQVRISSEEDMARVKGLRKKYDAILVGVGTVIADDPHLTIKGADYDTNPVRIVIDPHLRIPRDARVLDESAPTVIITLEGNEELAEDDDNGIDCEEIVFAGKEKIDLGKAFEYLADEIGIENILVEGGGRTISELFRSKLVDRYSVFVGPLIIGGSDSPTPCDGDGWVSDGGLKLTLTGSETLGEGVLLTYDVRF